MSYFQLKVTSAELITGGKSSVSACCGKDTPSTAKLFQLIGDESVDEQAAVLNYQALCDSSIHPTVENLTAPLSGKAKYDKAAYEQNWCEFQATCAQLDKNLAGKTFLLGDAITTADTTLAAVMKPAFENLLGEAERENYSNVARWYQTVSSQDSLKKLFKVNFIASRKEFNAADLKKKLDKEAEKARKKAEKEAKFAAKKAAGGAGPKKTKKPAAEKAEKKTGPEIVTYDEKTAQGAKKSTTCELPKAYSPKYVEAAWGAWWEKKGYFN